jgi:hypothetical protein
MTGKGKAKLVRATAIQRIVLRFMRKHGRWDRFTNGGEMLKYEDPVFQIIVSIQDQVPLELRRKFNVGPLEQGLYCLEIWEKGNGKVLNLIWNSVGAAPEIVTFRRGLWEDVFVPPRSRSWSPSLLGCDYASQVLRRRREGKVRG